MNRRAAPWLWVAAAFLIASTRAWELGLSLDPALFAAISRNLARDNQWWSLHASPNVFPQFFEHPFLEFWLQALVFKAFGASDYTSRFVGLGFGCLTFYFLFRLGEQLVDETFAHVLCLLTLLSVHFTGRIPTFYLDVPLAFFLIGGFYFFLRTLQTEKFGDGILCGLFLGCAVLAKGLAVLPVYALCVIVGVVKRRQYLVRVSALWITLGIALGIPTLCILLQNHYGSYSFFELYTKRFSTTELTKRAGAFYLFRTFSVQFIANHFVHMVLAVVGVVFFFVKRTWVEECRDVFWIAPIALLLLLSGNSTIGSYNLHYFYTIFPFANLLAATALYPVARRYASISWAKIGLGIAVFYQMLWHILPIPMRRKPDIDFFDLQAPVAALKKNGVENLESIAIDPTEFVYRELSLWYWDIDTVLRSSASEVKGGVVVVPNERLGAITSLKNGRLCHKSKKYSLYVTSEKLEEVCKTAVLDIKVLR